MIIEIHDREFAESEALQTALARTLWHQNVKKVDIFINSRVPDDAPEWKKPRMIGVWVEVRIRNWRTDVRRNDPAQTRC